MSDGMHKDGKAIFISIRQPEPTCRMIWYTKSWGDGGQVTNLQAELYVTPNWFHRLMIRIFFGFKFEILEGDK